MILEWPKVGNENRYEIGKAMENLYTRDTILSYISQMTKGRLQYTAQLQRDNLKLQWVAVSYNLQIHS